MVSVRRQSQVFERNEMNKRKMELKYGITSYKPKIWRPKEVREKKAQRLFVFRLRTMDSQEFIAAYTGNEAWSIYKKNYLEGCSKSEIEEILHNMKLVQLHNNVVVKFKEGNEIKKITVRRLLRSTKKPSVLISNHI